MKLWIRAATCKDSVFVHTNEKAMYEEIHAEVSMDQDATVLWPMRSQFIDQDAIDLCRRHMSRLLRGTGKRLPKHGSDEIVEVEVTAR